ncbi:LysR family transcriptional regulator [Lachnospiraceae bacterium 38-10]
MELNYIRHFVALAENGNYLETADALFMAQSSLSRHIKSLERELGAPLFERTTRKVVLNDFGRTFLPYARAMLKIQDECGKALQGYLDGVSSIINAASIPAMVQYHITDVFAGFQKENPGCRLNITEADSTKIWQLLEEGKCECGFIRAEDMDRMPEGMEQVAFTTDHLVAVLPAKHPFAKKKAVSLGMLRNEKFLFLDKETSMYGICINACREAGFEPDVAFTGFRGENLIDLAAKGMGVALLTRKPIGYAAGKEVVLADIEPRVTTFVSLVYPGKRRLSGAARRFIDYVKNHEG